MTVPIHRQFDRPQPCPVSNNTGDAAFLQFAHGPGGGETIEFTAVVTDVSPSMLIDDLGEPRLAVACAAGQALIRIKASRHPDDIVALVAFGGMARLLHLPAIIGQKVESLLRSLDNVACIDATDFHAALTLAESVLQGPSKPARRVGQGLCGMISKLLIEHPATGPGSSKGSTPDRRSKRIIFLSDGQQTQGPSPISVADRLKGAGVIIDCIGIADRAEVDEAALKAMASKNPDGSARYCFIQDRQSLIRKYETLAGHIRMMKEPDR